MISVASVRTRLTRGWIGVKPPQTTDHVIGTLPLRAVSGGVAAPGSPLIRAHGNSMGIRDMLWRKMMLHSDKPKGNTQLWWIVGQIDQ